MLEACEGVMHRIGAVLTVLLRQEQGRASVCGAGQRGFPNARLGSVQQVLSLRLMPSALCVVACAPRQGALCC